MQHFCCCVQYFVAFELSFAFPVPSYLACSHSFLKTFFISGHDSCIIFAVVRSTLLLLDFSLEYFVLS